MSRLCCMRLLSCILLLSLASALAANLTGTWLFSVDLDGGGHGTPRFVFEQKGEILNGTYKGPLGDRTVTGKVTGDQAIFSFDFVQNGQALKATYTARIESTGKMSGKVAFTTAEGEEGGGKWTASRK
jgi:hypothetical protein